MASEDYGIGIAYGLGIDKDGRPETHTMNKLKKLNDMLYSGEIGRGIIAIGSPVEVNREMVLGLEFEGKKFDSEKIYEDRGRSFVDHMYNIQNTVDRWIRNGEIPSNVLLHHLVSESKNNHMSVERAEFDAKWVIPMYISVVHGIEDGRLEKVIWKIDGRQEPKRMRTDKAASTVSKYLNIRPNIAQIIVSPIFDPLVIARYGRRFLPR